MEKRQVKITKLANAMVEIESSISVEELGKYRAKALKNLGGEMSMDGFRKGHIPENILVGKVGEMAILNEMANLALSDIYPLIILENKINAIGQPRITITKLAPHNPVEFKIEIAVMPEFTLPDYKDIAQKINKDDEKINPWGSQEVTDKEVMNAIEQIQKMNATPATDNNNSGNKSAEIEPPQVGDEKNKKVAPPKLPELTDEFVKKLGNFENVADFKTKIKDNIKKQKEHKAQEAKRVKIMDAILEKTKINLPDIIIAGETDRLLAQTKADITRMGLRFDKYLEHLKKTEEDLKKELRPDAEKRVKIQFILDEIVRTEKIKPDENEVEKNVAQILTQNKEAKTETVKPYVKMVLSNQEVFRLLEQQA